jgi:hypothetical protein
MLKVSESHQLLNSKEFKPPFYPGYSAKAGKVETKDHMNKQTEQKSDIS